MKISKNRFFYLLLALAIYFITSPFLVSSRINAYIFGVLFTVILIGSLYVVEKERRLLMVATVFGLPALAGHWLVTVMDLSSAYVFFIYLVTALFFMMMTAFVLRYIIHDQKISFNTLCGAVCGYLLIGLSWSFFYGAIFALSPESFSGASINVLNYQYPGEHFTYFSFVTLSTLGYGDLLPVSNPAKMFAWVEAVIGQIYLTVWIAQLVGLHIVEKTRKRNNA